MLNFSATQMEKLDAVADRAFALRLADYLTERAPEYLPFFAPEPRMQIVENLIARARALGFHWESSIGFLAELMLTVAPNVYQHPAIAPVLQRASDENLTFQVSTIAPGAWDEAEAARSDVPAWIAPAMDHAAGWEPVEAALAVILWDAPPDRHPALIDAAYQVTQHFGLPNSVDSYCVGAGLAQFYGEGFLDAKANPWLADVGAAHMTPQARLAALRARVMLDHARRV